MHTEKWIEQLRAALDYLNSDDISEAHRNPLKRATEAAILESTEEFEKHQNTANDGKRWSDAEIEVLRNVLENAGNPKSYNEEFHNLEVASLRLKRSPKIVKRKAVEIGLGKAVDYWLAKGGTLY